MDTNSTEQAQKEKIDSTKRLFESQQLTLQMAIPYLYQEKHTEDKLTYMLQSLQKFSSKQLYPWIPTFVYISVMSKQTCFHKFLNMIAMKSIPFYLSVRWSYATYIQDREELQKYRNKLDANLINHLSNPEQELTSLSQQQIALLIKKKQIMSNYINILNHFFQKLFRLPIKLKNYKEEKRQEELNAYLNKIFNKFSSYSEETYCTGICFPLLNESVQKQNSYVCVRFLKDQCTPFSTKDKIPFKFVFQTLNFQDYDQANSQVQSVKSFLNEQTMSQSSLVLPHSYFGIQWKQVLRKIRMNSPYGHLQSYQIHAYIVKSGDDVRQQHMAMQLIQIFEKVFEKEHLKLWVKSYKIIPFDKDCGLIQFVHGTKTISQLKSIANEKSLRTIYKQIFGQHWETAITNFTRSLAGYSLFQYIFQVKDRHNNNILVDTNGHIVHIDFSFMISSSPGNINFEKSPFKLTQDYILLMQGMDSDIFKHFKFLFFTGLKFIRKYKKQIMGYVLMMKDCVGMKCFAHFDQEKMEKRFHQNSTDQELEKIVDVLVGQAYQSYSTSNYDRYQYYTNYIQW